MGIKLSFLSNKMPRNLDSSTTGIGEEQQGSERKKRTAQRETDLKPRGPEGPDALTKSP